jgi:hypothetical protein
MIFFKLLSWTSFLSYLKLLTYFKLISTINFVFKTIFMNEWKWMKISYFLCVSKDVSLGEKGLERIWIYWKIEVFYCDFFLIHGDLSSAWFFRWNRDYCVWFWMSVSLLIFCLKLEWVLKILEEIESFHDSRVSLKLKLTTQ